MSNRSSNYQSLAPRIVGLVSVIGSAYPMIASYRLYNIGRDFLSSTSVFGILYKNDIFNITFETASAFLLIGFSLLLAGLLPLVFRKPKIILVSALLNIVGCASGFFFNQYPALLRLGIIAGALATANIILYVLRSHNTIDCD